MSRFLLLLVLIGWFAAESSVGSEGPQPLDFSPLGRQILMFGGFGLIVLIPALWSRVLARHVMVSNLSRSVSRFNWGTTIARALIPAWFAVCLFGLGWVQVVHRGLGPIGKWPVALPATFLGTLPPLLTWAALWWAAYPADRALREQSLLLQLQDDLPINAPPGFWSYFGANLRMQVLFTMIPIALILLLRDVLSLILAWGFHVKVDLVRSVAGSSSANPATIAEWVLLPISAVTVFVLAPEILRRVLQTQPLPDSDLRRRLEAICRRSKLRYRDILLWRTGNAMGNAAVMGVLPQVRYILLSDLLLQTMSDREIEAVFAHEAGHVVHRHLAWYGVFVIIVMASQLMIAKLAEMMNIQLSLVPPWMRDPLILLAAVAMFFVMFGFLSRCFERQADVFAARTMQQELAPAAMDHVGADGAGVFASALRRVAIVNNIPLRARNFSHGSILQRMKYVQSLSPDPLNTARFDRFMSWIFRGLICALLISIAWVGWMIWQG